jgi:hypothetical protein
VEDEREACQLERIINPDSPCFQQEDEDTNERQQTDAVVFGNDSGKQREAVEQTLLPSNIHSNISAEQPRGEQRPETPPRSVHHATAMN